MHKNSIYEDIQFLIYYLTLLQSNNQISTPGNLDFNKNPILQGSSPPRTSTYSGNDSHLRNLCLSSSSQAAQTLVKVL